MAKQANTLSLGTDNIGSLLWRYAAPAIIAMASNSIYHIIDSIFVGHGVGGAAIAGMAITMPIMNIAGAFGAMVGVGAAARMSIRLGEGNMQAAEKTLANAVMLNLILGFALMAFMLIFLDPILQLFSGGNASAETIGYARDFMRIILLGNMTQHMYLGLNEQIRASGYPQKSMRIILTAVALNLCLNPLFIFKFGWGIKGSALATVISQAVSFLIASSHFCQKSSFVRFRRAAFVLDWKIIKAILSIGLAPFMVNICASMVAAFVNTALLKYGGTGAHDVVQTTHASADIFVGAYGIANRVVMLLIMVIQGLNQGMQPIVGFNYGAKQYDRVRKALYLTIGCGMTISTLGFLACQIFPEGIASLFVDSSKGGDETLMIAAASQAMRTIVTMFPLVGFQIVAAAFFQYIGHAKLAIFVSMTRQMLFLLPLLWIIPRYMGATGVWISMPIADCASITLAAILLYRELKKLR
ncbi:MAG: MATE family efflux transporter [Rikenellaceae bacterium]|nr:MATE family efflux transporter [Rikenellaceae bacterium]